jgi:hypothetical protein
VTAPWSCHHGGGPGSYDESARRASHEELAVARALVADGHEVRTLAETRQARQADLEACGVPVEVKSFLSLADRQGRPPRSVSVANKLLDAAGQGALAVVWGCGSGLSEADARSGYRLYQATARARGMAPEMPARLIGDGFDISPQVTPPRREWAPAARSARRPAGPRATV